MSHAKRSYAFWPAILWLLLAVCGVLANRLAGRLVIRWWLVAYCWWILIVSLIAIAMFWWDKRAATRSNQRISEKTLHTVAAVGGWPGAVVGQQLFRHKSQKVPFRLVLWFIVIAHLGLACAIAWWQTNGG